MSMKIHDLVSGTPEWHAFRRERDTASEASAMMGVSSNTSRNDLLELKSTGTDKEFSDYQQKKVLDKGHAIEALARPIIEQRHDVELFPVTITNSNYPGKSASLDGRDETGIIWECKQWSEAKIVDLRAGRIPLEDKWQVVQQLVLSQAHRCIYTISDGTPEKTESLLFELDPADEKALLDGWAQFNDDVIDYKPKALPTVAVADPLPSLPALTFNINHSDMTISSNLSVFRAKTAELMKRLEDPIVTDQDFANRKALCKQMREAEALLKSRAKDAVDNIASVADFSRELTDLAEVFRLAALKDEKLVKAEEERRKKEFVANGKAALSDHIAALNAGLGGRAVLPAIASDFDGAMKNKRTMKSMQDSIDTELARCKIEANNAAELINTNLDSLREIASGYEFLFRDRQELVLKTNETLVLIAQQRVIEHKQLEQEKLEAAQVAEKLRKRIGEIRDCFTAIDDLTPGALEGRMGELQGVQLGEHWGEFSAEVAALKAEGIAAVQAAIDKLNAPEPAAPAPAPAPAAPAPAAPAAAPALEKPAAAAPLQAAPLTASKGVVSIISVKALLQGVIDGTVPRNVITIDMELLLEASVAAGCALPGTTWSKA